MIKTKHKYLTSTRKYSQWVMQSAETRKRLFVDVNAGGKLMSLQIDTGATCNVLRKADVPPGVIIQRYRKPASLTLFDGSTASTLQAGVVFHGYSNTVWEDSVRPEVPSGCRWELIFAWCASCATAWVNLHKQRGVQLKLELFCGPWNDTGRLHQQVSKGFRRTSWTVPRKSSPVCRSKRAAVAHVDVEISYSHKRPPEKELE